MAPQGIEWLQVKGFKTFADTSIELKSCNILIGGNGAGKSNLLSLLKLVRALADGRLQSFVGTAGGANDLLRRAIPPTRQLELGLHLRTMMGQCRYHMIAVRTDDDRLFIPSEGIEVFDAHGEPRGAETYENPGFESTAVELPVGVPPGGRVLLAPLRDLKRLRIFHFAETAVTAPAAFECELGDSSELRENGSNLAAYLFYLLNYQPTAYRLIVGTIRQALAGFGDFVLEPSRQSPPRIRLRWRMKGMDGDFGAHLLSDGSLRFILLTTLLGQPADHLPNTIAIDEPELGLHPAALNLVVSLIRVASHHCQVIVATQSAALVDCFEPEEVVVVHRQPGESTLQRLSSQGLEEWLKEYSLGELWEKNVVGGGPFG